MPNQPGFGYHTTESAWLGQPDDGDDQMDQEDQEVGHPGNPTKVRQTLISCHLGNSPWTGSMPVNSTSLWGNTRVFAKSLNPPIAQAT
jgi:hypothetical protein